MSQNQCGCGGKGPLPEVTFSTFVLSLASAALVHLGEVADPETGQTGQQPGQFHAGVPGDAHKTHFEYLHLPLLYLLSGPHLMTYFMRNS